MKHNDASNLPAESELQETKKAKLLFRCTIPGRVMVKKNSTEQVYSFSRGRTITAPSKRYRLWETWAAVNLRKAWRGRDPLSCPINARFVFHFKNHSAEPDLSNCYEGPQDALKKAGVITDDRIIQGHDGSRKKFGGEPRVEIELFEMQE